MAALMAAGTGLKAQEVTIVLKPGWTWISYPSADTVDFATALGTFTPREGDIIACEYDYSEYFGDEWIGDVQQFYPGYGFMYYSSRYMPVLLTMGTPLPQLSVTTAELTDITTTSAVVASTVTIDEGNQIYARGVCWGTEEMPTKNGSHISGDAIVGSQTIILDGLIPSTTYYVRAYMVTDYGLAYGNQRSFTTNTEHTYVDLGLPSGLLWATCNLGANNPEDYGDYFAWGETQPKDNFSWTNYQYCMGSFNTLTKYCNNPDIGYNGFTDDLTTLLPEDDAATANWGDEWRMPTEGEWQELYENTTVTWTTRNGVRGRLFTAENGNSIFMPAAGYCNESLPEAAGIIGDYWTSSLDTDYPSGALSFFFNSSNYYISFCNRLYGRNVRAVRSWAQIPNGYYNSANGKTGDELKVALHDIIKGHQVVSYNGLLNAFAYTDCKPNGKIWDIYSNMEYSLNTGLCGICDQEGDCWNREHTWPEIWFNESTTPRSDLFHVYPTDGFVNAQRSSYPYGEVNNPIYTSGNGSKLGPCVTPGYSGRVFEPIDEYKGDIARSYFYMSVRYYSEDSDWGTSAMTNKSEIKPWAMTMLLRWCDEDPVSDKEIARNNAVYGYQNNRNPFIDHPEYAHMIWDENW
jgi:endonuclease I